MLHSYVQSDVVEAYCRDCDLDRENVILLLFLTFFRLFYCITVVLAYTCAYKVLTLVHKEIMVKV